MENLSNAFWTNIRKLALSDRSVEVSDSLAQQAIDLFDRDAKGSRSFIFQLQPSFLGQVRRVGSANRFLFEFGSDMMVQLEQTLGDSGIDLMGFADGTDDGYVVLYGDGYVQEANLTAGNFEFKAVPNGNFAISFTRGDGTYWIRDLELREEETI